MNFELLYSAAHAEFPDTEPLGGGKAVADHLIRKWRLHAPFALTVLSPASLGLSLAKPITQMTERKYGLFCRQFEKAATAEILKRDPGDCVVLSNDISEGPDFALLGQNGYRIVTIFHVDVVEYFAKFYLRNLVPLPRLTKFHRFSLLPEVLKLVFQKQFECVLYSARIVVPSAPMRDTILLCYPECPPQKIVILPWGDVSPQLADAGAPPSPVVEIADIADDEFVLLTLSRLSPEKGIEQLLLALRHLDDAKYRLRVIICGAPAYMKGQRYARKLQNLAAQLKQIRVDFPGHVTGVLKTALLRRADLFVSPSLHESYGLSIAEATSAGCRVVSHHHYGASGTVIDCSKPMVFARIILEAVTAGRTPKSLPLEAPATAAHGPAPQLAELLVRAHVS
jgi:glycosyltransferase involved in cell wall biosynthesis